MKDVLKTLGFVIEILLLVFMLKACTGSPICVSRSNGEEKVKKCVTIFDTGEEVISKELTIK